jgi:hypothetical protein
MTVVFYCSALSNIDMPLLMRTLDAEPGLLSLGDHQLAVVVLVVGVAPVIVAVAAIVRQLEAQQALSLARVQLPFGCSIPVLLSHAACGHQSGRCLH